MNTLRYLLLVALFAGLGHAITIRQSTLSLTANEQTCTAGKPSTVFETNQRQAFLSFTANKVKRGESVTIEWVDPRGEVLQSTPYSDLQATSALCFLTQLPIAGFDAANRPGKWTIRVLANDELIHTRDFHIQLDPKAGSLRVTQISRQPLATGTQLTVAGNGFENGSTVHVAQYTELGGWKYLYRLETSFVGSTQLRGTTTSGIPSGDYMVIVQDSKGKLSQPARLLIESSTGYRLPLAAGEPWLITQGPYGGFSHFNRTSQAWDIAPIGARCIVAMRGGVVHAFDKGLGQTQQVRSFGNYITIAHDNGEFSHYAHLKSGSFQVANGQRVEQGQALAVVGNSGYTFGRGGGYHVHVQVTREFNIAAASIPFRFEDLPDPARSISRTVVSRNASPFCNCGAGVRQSPASTYTLAARVSEPNPVRSSSGSSTSSKWPGTVQVEQWWSQIIQVAKRTGAIEVALTWKDEGRDLDLHLMGPDGKHYGSYGITDGYSGSTTGVERFIIANPTPGLWRISVRGTQGPPGDIPFEVELSKTSGNMTQNLGGGSE